MSGARLPALAPGDRLRLRLSGSARGAGRSVALDLETRWVRPGRGKKDEAPHPRRRLRRPVGRGPRPPHARILKLRDFRPTIVLEPLARTAGRRRG